MVELSSRTLRMRELCTSSCPFNQGISTVDSSETNHKPPVSALSGMTLTNEKKRKRIMDLTQSNPFLFIRFGLFFIITRPTDGHYKPSDASNGQDELRS